MKSIIDTIKGAALIAFAILAVGLTAQAQSDRRFTTVTLNPTIPNVLLSTSSNYVTSAVLDCTKMQNVCFGFQYMLDSAASGSTTNTVQVWLQKSVDGAAWNTDTNTDTVVSLAPNGTTLVVTSANINVAAAGYLRIRQVVNGNGTGNATNLVYRYSLKVGAP